MKAFHRRSGPTGKSAIIVIVRASGSVVTAVTGIVVLLVDEVAGAARGWALPTHPGFRSRDLPAAGRGGDRCENATAARTPRAVDGRGRKDPGRSATHWQGGVAGTG